MRTALVKVLYRFELVAFALCVFSFLFYFTFHNVLYGDEREHVYASFLVLKGYVPYRDFFEHHHPLLWYIFSPVVAIFFNNENIWYAVRGFALLLLLVDCWLIVKICQFISKSRIFAVLAVLFFCAPEVMMLEGISFRPDVLMITFILAGTYFLFCFFENAKTEYLSVSFVLFWLAVMTLQKALLVLLPMGCFFVYALIKSYVPMRKTLWALLPVGVLTGFFGYCLLSLGMFKDYFELNWMLNAIMRMEYRYPVHLTIYYNVANVLALVFLWRSKNLFLRIIAFHALFLSIMWQFVIYAPFRHYWLSIYPYLAIVAAYGFVKLADTICGCVIFFGVICGAFFNYITLKENMAKYGNLSLFVYLSSIELSLSDENDLIIGNTSVLGGLRLDAMGYYWFGRDYIALLDYMYFHRREFPVEDNVLKARRPKIISAEDRRKCMTEDYKFAFDCHSVPTYDREFLDAHYYNQGFIYVRKN